MGCTVAWTDQPDMYHATRIKTDHWSRMDATDRGFWMLRAKRLAATYNCPSLIVSVGADPSTKRREVFCGFGADGQELSKSAALDAIYPPPPRATSAR